MARLQDLPTELITKILKALSHRYDQYRLGLSCPRLYDIARPEIYRTLTIPTVSPSRVFKHFLIAHRHHEYVKELVVVLPAAQWALQHCPLAHSYNQHFYVHDIERQEEGWELDEQAWLGCSSPILTLLRGDCLGFAGGSLRKITLSLPRHFRYDVVDVSDNPDDGQFHAQGWVIYKKTLERIDRLLAGVAVNPTIKTLEIINMPPYESPVYATPAWKRLMNRLECFEVSTLGQQILEHYGGHGVLQYPPSFVKTTAAVLATRFFNHLSSVRTLKITVDEDEIKYHFYDMGEFLLQKGAHYMPALMRLELVNTVMQESLLQFLDSRPPNSPPLSLTLTNAKCLTGQNDWMDMVHEPEHYHNLYLQWHEAFDRLAKLVTDGNPPVVREFELTPVTSLDRGWLWGLEDEQVAALGGLKASMAVEPRPIFPYMSLDVWESGLVGDMVRTLEADREGRDRAAYDELNRSLATIREDGPV